MLVLEITLLIIAYTTLVIALVFEVICFKRNLESWETIAFTFSLLLLILSISVSAFFDYSSQPVVSSITTLLCMTLVGCATLLNTLSEREHTLPAILRRAHVVLGILVLVLTIVSYFTGGLQYVQWLVVIYLIASVVGSMIIIRMTTPQRALVHLEKVNRFFSMSFLVLIPVYLILHYGFEEQYAMLQIGFLLPLFFILLASSKIYDDLKRLSILKDQPVLEQQFANYGLTDRETEVAKLLSKGCSYQSISEQLFISLPTVKTHTSNIYKKCSVKNKHELIVLLTN